MSGKDTRPHWQTLEEYAEPSLGMERGNEFAPEQHELEIKDEVGRRRFLGIMGSTMALAGGASAGCIRKPYEKILPYSNRPEEMLPGESQYYASTLQAAGAVCGVLVESFDGRPIKIEGNPDHPGSMGGTNHFVQAEILNLYDQDRLTKPMARGQALSLADARSRLGEMASKFAARNGRGLAFVSEWVPSPTYQELLATVARQFPEAKFYIHDEARSSQADRAMRMLGLPGAQVKTSFDAADVVVSIDADFLGLEGETVRHTKEFTRRRKLEGPASTMSRLYISEPFLTLTGSTADHRLLLPQRAVWEVLIEIARKLNLRGVSLPGSVAERLGQTSIGEKHAGWIDCAVDDLIANQGRSVVVVGERCPDWVHALGLAVNQALGNFGRSVSVYPSGSQVSAGTIDQLAVDIKSGLVSGLVIVGGNTSFSAPGDLGVAELLGRVEDSVYLGMEADETAQAVQFALPRSHDLEAWGDYYTVDGQISLRQPLIAPLYESLSEIEFLGSFLGGTTSGFDYVQAQFKRQTGNADFAGAWKRALHDGVTPYQAFLPINFDPDFTQLGVYLRQQSVASAPSEDRIDLVFAPDYSTYDGRYSNNAWLQELPDPLTKLTWDNALLISPSSAAALGLERGDLVEVSVGSVSQQVAIFVQPGVAPFSGVLSLGYGRKSVGTFGIGTGFDAGPLRSARSPYFAEGAKLKKVGGSYLLATTQGHQRMEGRPIVRENTIAGFRKDPEFVNKYEVMPLEKQKTFLWKEPNKTDGQQWGMTIDLNSCTGCNTCVIACQSENNVAIVGKEEVDRNREMAWIRIDRYFTGSVDDPQVVVQPVNCLHCESAPCEGVCPVGATIHSPEGMNDMAYNRCIGTRYCANNCPYKVRRFNYFNFSKRQDEANPLMAMQQNPNVTVRFRGVIEKCSYCVQRVNKARITAKRDGDGIIQDGAVQTACQQACPADAIEFGDINNPRSRVARAKQNPRNYAMLGELNTRPRTTYLAKVRNPHEKLV